MQKTEPQRGHAQQQPAAKQAKAAALESPQGKQIAQLEAMANDSPQAQKLGALAAMMNASPAMAAQRKLADMIHNSPRQTAQAKLFDAIHNSPRQAAQREKFDSLFGTAQRAQEEELPAQREKAEEPLQQKTAQREEAPAQLEQQPAAKPNNTGLPDNLKSGIESLSGMSMDNVRVHYNSSQPAQLNAHAYAQGTDIHVAPGQEKHLPHEAWHVVQQAQGRVRPTMQMKGGMPVNDDVGLEHEADVMGGKAAFAGVGQGKSIKFAPIDSAAQRIKIKGKKMEFPEIAKVIEQMKELSKGVKQKFLQNMHNDDTNFDSPEDANAYILSEAKKLGPPVDHEQIKNRGDDTEAAAASSIGGQVNRGKNGRDVEWRFITRDEAELLKKARNIGNGSGTDQELFEDWKKVLSTVDGQKLIGKNLNDRGCPEFCVNGISLLLGHPVFKLDGKPV